MGTDAEPASAVIPGFQPLFIKKLSGSELPEENEQSVQSAAQREPYFMGDTKQRTKKGGAAVDREHPQGSGSFQLKVAPLKRYECGVKDLEAPARNAAVQKQFKERHGGFFFLCCCNCFFHIHRKSMDRTGKIIHNSLRQQIAERILRVVYCGEDRLRSVYRDRICHMKNTGVCR